MHCCSSCASAKPNAVLSHGQLQCKHELSLAGRAYIDPGATASDNVDGNITSRLSTFGLGAVDTSAPNNASDPFYITYDVSDSAGNAAVRGLRGVLVVCRPPRVLCTAGDGTLYCSTSTGLCVQLTPATPGGTAAVAPTIKLVGQAVLGVPLGSSYLACPTPQPTSVVCDRSDFGYSRGSCFWAVALLQHMLLVFFMQLYSAYLCTTSAGVPLQSHLCTLDPVSAKVTPLCRPRMLGPATVGVTLH